MMKRTELLNMFRRVDTLDHQPLAEVEFKTIQGYIVNGEVMGLDVVFCSKEDKRLQISIPVPKQMAEIYEHQMRVLNADHKLHLEVMPMYQSAVGVYLREVIVCSGEGDKLETWFHVVTDFGESYYCRVPAYVAMIYAITHKLKISVEKRRLEMKTIVSTVTKANKYMGDDVTINISAADIMWLLLQHEESNAPVLAEITDEQLADELSLKELKDLKDKVVEVEKYEWAQRLSRIISEKECADKDGE